MTYECWNTTCQEYAGAGVTVKVDAAPTEGNRPSCPSCGRALSKAPQNYGSDLVRVALSVAAGALLGWVFVGGAGVLLGGVCGLALCAVWG